MPLKPFQSVGAALAIAVVSATDPFSVAVNGVDRDCNFVSNSDYYGTQTKTTTEPQDWYSNTYSGKYPTNYGEILIVMAAKLMRT